MKIRLIESPLAIPRYRQVRLPTVAAELAPYAEVTINDENVEPLETSPVDLVGFTAQVYNVHRAVALSGEFRARGIKTILGGPQATAMPQWALQHFDAVVVGEVEGLGARIVGDLEQGKLAGIYRNETPPDLARARLPRRDLQKAERYYSFNYPIELTRGCPNACSFCFNRYQYGSVRHRPLQLIEQDLANWDHGMVEVIDLHMAANRTHLMDVCALFRSAGVKGWFGECTLDSLDDDELLRALEDSHCKMVFVGLESIDPKALRSVGKGFNQDGRYRDLIRKVQDRGIFVHAGLIWGLDGVTPETYQATLEFCEDANLYLASNNMLTFYPGTKSYERIKADGRLLTEDFRNFDSAHVVVEPQGMTVEELCDQTARFVNRFYSLGSITRRSFQVPNYRTAQLVDYWAFNLVYRAYYRTWSRQALAPAVPIPEDPSTRGKPLAFARGGSMPVMYALMDLSWRFFHRYYQIWEKPPGGSSVVLAMLVTVLAGAGAWFGLHVAQLGAAEHWPVPWPTVGITVPAFMGASLVSCLAVYRLACARMPPLLAGAGLLLSLFPMLAAVLASPEYASGWRLAMMLLVLLFFLKAWSVLRSGSHELKGWLRVASFIFFFPSLHFDGAFQHDTRKRPLVVHWPLVTWGFCKLVASTGVALGLAWVDIHGWDDRWAGIPFDLGRVLFLYLWLSGALDYLAGSWRMAGYTVGPGFKPMELMGGIAKVWQSINVPFHDWLLRYVYIPLGGNRRPVLAVMGAFIFSGLLFEVVFGLASNGWSGRALGFFTIHGFMVAVAKRGGARPGRVTTRPLLVGGVGLAVLLVTAPLFLDSLWLAFQ